MTRKKLGNLCNLGLAHIKWEVAEEKATQDHGMSWTELLKLFDPLNKVTDEDEEKMIARTVDLFYGDEDNDEQPG